MREVGADSACHLATVPGEVVESTDAVTGRWVDGVAPEAYDWCMALPD